MSQMYSILTVVGWTWLVAVGIFLAIALTMKAKQKQARGFEVIPSPNDAPAQPRGDGAGLRHD